jgi:hypothetical protein
MPLFGSKKQFSAEIIAQLLLVSANKTLDDKFLLALEQSIGAKLLGDIDPVGELTLYGVAPFELALASCNTRLLQSVHPHVIRVALEVINDGRRAMGTAPIAESEWNITANERLAEYMIAATSPPTAGSSMLSHPLGQVAKIALSHLAPRAPFDPSVIALLGGHFANANKYAKAILADNKIC